VTAASEKIQGTLGNLMKQQSQLQQNVRRVWERIDLIEAQQTKSTLAELKQRLDRLEGDAVIDYQGKKEEE
jgi:uncharacterized protein YukE